MKSKKNIIYEETGKIIYQNEDENDLFVEYSDDIDLNPKEKVRIKNIGNICLNTNSFFLDYLNAYNIPSALKKMTDNILVFAKYFRLPFYIKILNLLDKRSAKIFDKQDGIFLQIPILTFHYGNSADNFISESHLISLDICPLEDIKMMKRICSKVNAVLKSFCERRNTTLAEFNCYFGKENDKILVIDDFTPMSLKIIQNNAGNASINPYKIKSAEEIKNYSEFIQSLISSE